jgi:hypothetical protein
MEAVSFSPFDASRIANSVKWVERHCPGIATDEERADDFSEIYFGTAASDYSSGSTISLTPCDCNGVATGEAAVTCSIPTSWGTVDLLSATVGGVDDVTVTCKIASGTLLQYAYAENGTAYLLGLPPQLVIADERDRDGIQIQVAWLFGTNVSTYSDWLPVAGVRYGKLTGLSWTGGAKGSTVTLQPCDAYGTTLQDEADPPVDLPTVNVYLPWDLDTSHAIVGGASVAVGCYFYGGDIFQYTLDSDGDPVLLGLKPAQVISEVKYDSSAHSIEVKVRWLAGSNSSNVSDWVTAAQFTSYEVGQAIRWNSTDKKFETAIISAYLPEASQQGSWTDLTTSKESLPAPCYTPGS